MSTTEKRIYVDYANELGHGYFGAVYRGRYRAECDEHIDVGVKVIDLTKYTQERDHQWETDAMKKMDHVNVLRLYAIEYEPDSGGFPLGYLALELCAGTLTDYFKGKISLSLGTDSEMYGSVETKILRQITLGMEHVHESGFVHKDLKPDNILVQVADVGQFTVKLADFGLVRRLEGGLVQPDCHNTGNDSTKAPERSEESLAFGTTGMDIFSLGVIFHEVLTKGVHPFDVGGNGRVENIRSGTYSLELLLRDGKHDAVHLIRQMISRDRSERPTAWQVLRHPLVWTNEDKRIFAKRCKDGRLEISGSVPLDKEALFSLQMCLFAFDEEDAACLGFRPVDCGLSPDPLLSLVETYLKIIRFRNPYWALKDFEKYIPCFTFFVWLSTSDTTVKQAPPSLHLAVELNETEQVRDILESGGLETIDQPNSEGETPLHIACKVASLEAVQLLLSSGAQLDLHDQRGLTPLHRAALRGDLDIIRLLVDTGAPLEARETYTRTPLHLAAAEHKPDVVELLLEKGAEVNARTRRLETPLHLAAEKGCEGNIQVLIASGAEVDAVDSSGRTALFSAGQSANINTVSCLVERGASFNVQDDRGNTTLHYFIYCDRDDLVGKLLQFHPDVNVRNKRGDTPLHAASRLAHENIMQQLIQAGADPDMRDEDGMTAAAILEEELRTSNEVEW